MHNTEVAVAACLFNIEIYIFDQTKDVKFFPDGLPNDIWSPRTVNTPRQLARLILLPGITPESWHYNYFKIEGPVKIVNLVTDDTDSQADSDTSSVIVVELDNGKTKKKRRRGQSRGNGQGSKSSKPGQ